MEQLNYLIRPAIENDSRFIFSSWNKSYKANNLEMYYCTKHQIYNRYMRDKQLEIFKKGAVSLVAVSEEDPNQILGYIVFQAQKPPIIHYLYTKQIYRNLGIARSLLKKVGLTKEDMILCSMTTKACYKSKYNVVYLPDTSLYLFKE